MTGSKTAYMAQKMLDHGLGGTAFTRPTTVYLALSTAAFDAAATGTVMNEVTGGSYARLSLPNSSATWSAATSSYPSEKHNLNLLSFVTATSDWGTPMSAYLADAATGGNLLYGSDIVSPQAVLTGDQAKIAATAFGFNEY